MDRGTVKHLGDFVGYREKSVRIPRRGLVKLEVGKALKAWYMRQRGKVGYNKLFPSDRSLVDALGG